MVKIQKYGNSVSPFSGISFVNASFNKVGLSQLIDSELGKRVKYTGYSYSEIIRNLTNVFLSGGDVIEDVGTHLGVHLKEIPNNNVPSPDTIQRGLKELSTENTVYESKSGINYNFNINKKLNLLNIKALILTNQLEPKTSYDFDYDNQITANKKYDAKRTYKHSKGYFPGVATIGNSIVYIENRDGNANVKFKQAETLENAYRLLKSQDITINRSRMDAGSYSKEIIDVVAKNSKLFYIRANKSDAVFEQIQEISDWKEIELNYKNYQVASIKFKQFNQDKKYRLVIMREKTSNNQIDAFTQDTFKYRSILTNDWENTEKHIIEYYNNRGASEKIFDVMNNDFGWKRMPFSFLNENNTFMIITAMIKNFYNYFVALVSNIFENIEPRTRLKRFVFRFISVAGKWVYQGRRWILKLYTKEPYEQLII
jgi:hypothetical protein